MQVDYAIIGAGPTGLGAAQRLAELGCGSYMLLEKNTYAGGLAASFKDAQGYTWDIGGHVVFSHYEYFDRLLDDLLGDGQLRHQRKAWVRACGTWVPYPFQNNIRHLPAQAKWRCVEGLLPGHRPEAAPQNFRQWIHSVFGQGIAEVFLWPYNYKVWAIDPAHMNTTWVGERVSVINLETVLKNIILELDEVGWGPNRTFAFPAQGGTGEVFRRLAARHAEHIRYGCAVAKVDAAKKTLTTAEGEEIVYKQLLSTGPLDLLLRDQLAQAPDALIEAAGRLKHNGVFVAGVGARGRALHKGEADDRCWMYFPESDCPFYRVTNFHNYAPANVPGGDADRAALLCETSFSEHKREDLSSLMDKTIAGLDTVGLLAKDAAVGSRFSLTVDYGYPVPCLERDRILREVQPWLEAQGIYSRGRFGGWKYEVSNMDHSVMQGVEWAERMMRNEPEKTYQWS
jgi:UDP-galactopyranose mutase